LRIQAENAAGSADFEPDGGLEPVVVRGVDATCATGVPDDPQAEANSERPVTPIAASVRKPARAGRDLRPIDLLARVDIASAPLLGPSPNPVGFGEGDPTKAHAPMTGVKRA
jgi:hypothetical protein